MRTIIALIVLGLVAVGLAEDKVADDKKKTPVVRARIVVKEFLYEDLPFYHEAKVRYSPGADPVMHLYDNEGKDIKQVDVAEMSRSDIRSLLESHGLKKSDSKMPEEDQSEDEEEEPIPDEEPTEYPDEEDDVDEMPEERSAEKEEL